MASLAVASIQCDAQLSGTSSQSFSTLPSALPRPSGGFRSRIQELEHAVEEYHRSHAEHQRDTSRLKTANVALKVQLSDSKQSAVELAECTAQLRQELHERSQDTQLMRNQCRELTAHVKKAAALMVELTATHKRLKEQVEEQVQSVESDKAENRDLRAELTQRRKDVQDDRTTLKHKIELQISRISLLESERDTKEKRIQLAETEHSMLKAELESLKRTVAQRKARWDTDLSATSTPTISVASTSALGVVGHLEGTC